MKFNIGDRVFNDRDNKFGTIIEWYEDNDGDDERGRPIIMLIPVVKHDDGTEAIVRDWYLQKEVFFNAVK